MSEQPTTTAATPEPYKLLGPFVDTYKVLVNGREVPFLTGEPANGGRIFLSVDNRMCVDMSVQDAERLVPFIAHCIAIGMGFTGFPDQPGMEPVLRPPFPRCTEIGSVVTDE